MMEVHPWEAVFNNIAGTQNILGLCAENGVDRFVFVSTDKAVRPTNVMGASKRVCEILVQLYASEYDGRFMSVRFGNVLGSVGSVVPLFERQIKRGGPVTVTHREVTRYFMSIREAARLILQAGALGMGGEIFILKMGEPVRILDMARDIIRLSGLKPDEDIEIKEIGLLPGEKLYEELITEGEGIQETEHEEIMVLKAQSAPQLNPFQGAPDGAPSEILLGFHGVKIQRGREDGGQSGNELTLKKMRKHMKRLVRLAEAGDGKGIREELKRIVPEYQAQRSGVGGRGSEVGSQKSEVGGQKSEVGSQKSEVRSQRSEDGNAWG
jgi:hypothetical protein